VIPTRRLGGSNLTVSAIGLGCMGMSQAYGVPDDEESVRTLHLALDRGITFFDTADVYGAGANERLIGPVLSQRRDSVVLATKCGLRPGTGGAPIAVDGTPEHIHSACDASLARLGTEFIDLYYLHRVDPAVPIEDSVGAMAGLVKAGKVRYLGLSEVSAATLRRAHAVHPIAAVQSEYSLFSRDPEAGILPACRELGVAFVPFSPLGRGFLSGEIGSTDVLPAGDMRRSVPRFQDENLARNIELVTRLREIASTCQCTAAQLALAWVLAQGNDIVPIPGTKRRTFLEENIAAAGIGLSDAEVATLNELFAPGAAAGERYSHEMMRLVDRA
jgi:aryl-alcohol dehydrogenase-like predicted oxidoreductase